MTAITNAENLWQKKTCLPLASLEMLRNFKQIS